MENLPSEVDTLLRDIRNYLANSNDPWEQRRDLMNRINEHVAGGESDMLVASVREMGRVGANYATMLQSFNQFFSGMQPGMNLPDMIARSMAPNPFLHLNQPAMDFFRQMTDFFNTQTRNMGR